MNVCNFCNRYKYDCQCDYEIDLIAKKLSSMNGMLVNQNIFGAMDLYDQGYRSRHLAE